MTPTRSRLLKFPPNSWSGLERSRTVRQTVGECQPRLVLRLRRCRRAAKHEIDVERPALVRAFEHPVPPGVKDLARDAGQLGLGLADGGQVDAGQARHDDVV